MVNKTAAKLPAILQINTRDIGGGAEKTAWNLFQAYKRRGYTTWLAVGYKHSIDPDIVSIPNNNERNGWARFWRSVGIQLSPFVANTRGAWQLQTLLYGFGEPQWWLDIQRGHEDFNYPGTGQLLELSQKRPDIIHCHNLHGRYFDLRALPWLSQHVPILITLHDTWLLSGHCAYSLDCERWRTGCGHCPYLKIYPAIPQDATAYNWQRKRHIFSQSSLYIATPSQWLMEKVKQSMLAPAVKEARVVPIGIDLSVFQPIDKQIARAALDIPPDVKVFLFVASNIKKAFWKDYQTMRNAVAQVVERKHDQNLLFIALGNDAPAEWIGQAELRFVPFQKDHKAVARYYQAADVYLHAAHVDNFPAAVLEALACGTPVVATAVGGIPEQIKSLEMRGSNLGLKGYPPDEATGVLVPAQDANEMAMAIEWLLNDDNLSRQLGKNAARDAHSRFSFNQQIDTYLSWYQEILEHHHSDVQPISLPKGI